MASMREKENKCKEEEGDEGRCTEEVTYVLGDKVEV